MRQHIVPVLLLAMVALSSSNVLPMSVNDFNREQLNFDSQHINDNTFSDRYQTRNVLDKTYVPSENKARSINKLQFKYADADNNENDNTFNIISKDDNYGEGFRKEQWHNNPRQLDRLHLTHEHNTDKNNIDPNKEYNDEVASDNQDVNDKTDDPLLILKIRLASLNRDIYNANAQYVDLINTALKSINLWEDEMNEFRNENSEVNVLKVKQEGETSTQNNKLTDNPTQTRAVNKRIFSLWSRLQAFNNKGHELPRRQHLLEFYGEPDSAGLGAHIAETRAKLMRPPGSPLRWG